MKFNHSQILALCKEIDMPEEPTEMIVNIIKDHDFSDLEDYFNMLFTLDTGDEGRKKIESTLKESPNSLKPLAVYLAAALKTWDLYEKLGISRHIYIDSMKEFSRFVGEHLETFGCYGFDRDFWIYRVLSTSIFRLGTLEFEMRSCPNNEMLEGYAVEGDKLISVHIPSDAVMTRDNLNLSYKMAGLFFKKYFPEFGEAIVYCSTWLLAPELKNLLPETSKILEFQSDYKIIKTSPGNTSFIKWVYKKNYDDYTQLPENTSLQRNIKHFLLSGGQLSSATGINSYTG